jgi:hypothetical protein
MSKPKYKLNQTVYLGQRDQLKYLERIWSVKLSDHVGPKWIIEKGGVHVYKITEIITKEDDDGVHYSYHVGTESFNNLLLKEEDMPRMCYLSEEEALRAWAPSNKEIVEKNVKEKIKEKKQRIKRQNEEIKELEIVLNEYLTPNQATL